MTLPHGAVPVSSLHVRTDPGNGFCPLDLDQEGALERDGSIVVLKSRNGKFQINLVDRIFRDEKRALLPQKPGLISRDETSIFNFVQRCRGRWEDALESVKFTSVKPGGDGTKTHFPYEEKWDCPVNETAFHSIAGRLAVAGDKLFTTIFGGSGGTALDDIAQKLRETVRSGELVLTVYAPDFHLPWRMLYTHPTPTDKLAPDGSNFDPRGFWGYQHIIEQFTNDYEIKDHVRAKEKLSFGAAVHDRLDTKFNVECLARHRLFVQANGEHLAYEEWTTKAAVESGLSAEPFPHQVVYFLCHAEGAGTIDKPTLKPTWLGFADGEIDTVGLCEYLIHGFAGSPPLVFINACRGGHLGTLTSHNFTFASEFLERGVICLIAPQIEIPAVFAGEFGKRFFEQFISGKRPPPRVGVVLRDLTRDMWKRLNPFGLAYSLYAGADCHIRWDKRGGTAT
jgi:hypothetical protein